MSAAINEPSRPSFESSEARSLALNAKLAALVEEGFAPKEIRDAAAAMEASALAPRETAEAAESVNTAEAPLATEITAVTAALKTEISDSKRRLLTQRALGTSVSGVPYLYSDRPWPIDNLLRILSFELEGREDAIDVLAGAMRSVRPAIIPSLTVLTEEINKKVAGLAKIPDDDTWLKMQKEIEDNPEYLALFNLLARIKNLGTMVKDPEKTNWPTTFGFKTKAPLEKELSQKMKELPTAQSNFASWVTAKSLVGKFLPPGVEVGSLTDYTADGDVLNMGSNLVRNLKAKLESINEPSVKLAQPMLVHHKRLSAELADAEAKGVVVDKDQKSLIALPKNIEALLGMAG